MKWAVLGFCGNAGYSVVQLTQVKMLKAYISERW